VWRQFLFWHSQNKGPCIRSAGTKLYSACKQLLHLPALYTINNKYFVMRKLQHFVICDEWPYFLSNDPSGNQRRCFLLRRAQCTAKSHLNQYGNINWMPVSSAAHQIQRHVSSRCQAWDKIAGWGREQGSKKNASNNQKSTTITLFSLANFTELSYHNACWEMRFLEGGGAVCKQNRTSLTYKITVLKKIQRMTNINPL
jgi:hypothetical protein